MNMDFCNVDKIKARFVENELTDRQLRSVANDHSGRRWSCFQRMAAEQLLDERKANKGA